MALIFKILTETNSKLGELTFVRKKKKYEQKAATVVLSDCKLLSCFPILVLDCQNSVKHV